ncbi:MAG: nucleotide sugar dehydrogenase, partial [Myxococcales bacterium]|nr:nucleotide sugar dehydrogenase [Myxococcales bacterium]
MTERIAVLGLGYVGLPVALAFARKFAGTVGFDVDATKVAELARGHDRNGEVSADELTKSALEVTSDLARLADATFYVVAVPTPVDENHVPDLGPVVRASETVGKVLRKGDVVVYESTVYPGVTEDVCAPILARVSGLAREDFKLGYSPERINP